MDGGDSLSQSARFDLVYSKSGMAFGNEPEPELANFVKSSKRRGNALDLGCGDGRNALFLAKMAYNVTGVDVSKVAVKKLGAIAAEKKLSQFLQTVHSDARDFKYPPNIYDLVVAVTLFDHIPKQDLIPLFEKVADSIKSGGILFTKVHTIKDPGKTNGSDKASELSWAIQHYFEPDELKEILEKKFKVIKYLEYDDQDNSHGRPHFHNFAVSIAQKL
ncbi:MAG TPA: class I SAM-dependent methyltransferase [candidate division Zixibacteria bacterium]|nr:class I SAM-dependent methyltransferase [candidate division Zixibacteria bacterium]